MKTYSETVNAIKFDWIEALSQPCEEMSAEDAENLSNMSGQWCDCACGNQDARIPRLTADDVNDGEHYRIGEPLDPELRSFGFLFQDQVEAMVKWLDNDDMDKADANRERARLTMHRIEARAEQIIASLTTIP